MADKEEKSPLDQALDLLVYAPLGFALAARDVARENLPSLIERGRQQLSSQFALARMMGQYAVKEAEKEAQKRFGGVAETINAARTGPPSGNRPASASTPAPAASPAPAPAADQAADAGPTNGKAAPTAPAGPARSSAHLAIPGYDTLSASQVVQRLAGLAPGELEAVREYEAATRGRRTILSRATQLQGDKAASE